MVGDAGNDVELFGMKRSKASTELEPLGIGCVRAWCYSYHPKKLIPSPAAPTTTHSFNTPQMHRLLHAHEPWVHIILHIRLILRLFLGNRGSRRNMVPNSVSYLSCGAVQSASGSAPTPQKGSVQGCDLRSAP